MAIVLVWGLTFYYLNKFFAIFTKLIENRSFTTHKELQSFVGLFSSAAQVFDPDQAFLRQLCNELAKGRKYLH